MLRTALLFVSFLCVLFPSCKTDTAKVSNEEALAAGKKLEALAESGDMEGIAAFFDMTSFFALITEKSRASRVPGVMNEFKSGNSIMRYAQQFITNVQSGDISILRGYEENGRQRLIFRLVGTTGRINYHEFYLKKVKNTVKVYDAMNYAAGDLLSTVLADELDLMIAGSGTAEKEAQAAVDIKLFYQKKYNGDFEGIKEAYRKLPAEVQQNKRMLLTYIDACQNTNDSSYKASMEQLTQLFPITSATCLYMISTSLQAEDYKKALLATDKLDKLMGGDPFLDHLRGNVYQLMGKPAESIPFYEKVYAAEPDLIINLKIMLIAYMKVGDKVNAGKIAAAYKANKDFNEEELGFLKNVYPEFVN